MALNKLNFTKDWKNPEDFPTVELSEEQVRADMQVLYDEIRDFLNERLLPQLERLGVETTVQLPEKGAGFKYIRMGAERGLEISADGVAWTSSGLAGHTIVSEAGTEYPQRVRLRFENCSIWNESGTTVVRCAKGEKGDTGPQGPAGTANVPRTTAMLKGNGSGGVVAAKAGTDYALPPVARKVTLSASGWGSSMQQSVSCPGVLADTTKQAIRVTPVDTSYKSVFNECGVMAVGQSAGRLTFQCFSKPTSDIDVYVRIDGVKYEA
nr:MAG TPA_asm: collagen alpha 1(VIII) chain protein [Caudoviricetes sp.]